jgi:hypothetical protein
MNLIEKFTKTETKIVDQSNIKLPLFFYLFYQNRYLIRNLLIALCFAMSCNQELSN